MVALTERNSPVRLGAAVGVGIFIGVSPFIGLHLIICIVVATLLRLNRAVTYLAANISIPIFAPFLIFTSVQLGAIAHTGHPLPFRWQAYRELDHWQFFDMWLLGASILGVILGLPAALLTTFFARKLQKTDSWVANPINEAMNKTAESYRTMGRFTYGYVRGKFQHDPAYKQLAQRLPVKTPVIDIGCGRGQTLLLLQQLQPNLTGVGIDWDSKKIAMCQQLGKANLRWQQGDIRTCPYPNGGTILMLDVLHYNEYKTQDAMLHRAIAALEDGGTLVIRDIDSQAGWRAKVNMWQERLGNFFGVNRGATFCFRPIQEVVELLRSHHFQVEVINSYGELPLANVLVIGTKIESKN